MTLLIVIKYDTIQVGNAAYFGEGKVFKAIYSKPCLAQQCIIHYQPLFIIKSSFLRDHCVITPMGGTSYRIQFRETGTKIYVGCPQLYKWDNAIGTQNYINYSEVVPSDYYVNGNYTVADASSYTTLTSGARWDYNLVTGALIPESYFYCSTFLKKNGIRVFQTQDNSANQACLTHNFIVGNAVTNYRQNYYFAASSVGVTDDNYHEDSHLSLISGSSFQKPD